MENKEIELKFVINKDIKENIILDLETKNIKKTEQRLIDTYYIPNFKDFEINGETIECVRIRENENGITLAYKKVHKDATPVYCDEYETIISDKQQMEKILFAIGFSVQMVIDKVRLTYKLENFEIDFDSVKELGELMEVELKNEFGNIKDIYNFVSDYGLTKNDVTYDGIQTMMKKLNKKPNNIK